ncbi:hypothetical protein B0H63DRAFT_523323 [Podospora didyma]|uniref:Uncharacterized protein n=1 Tax=Podospora didyma TaxID=330526 RepID=A0AAE0NQR4_9PEZI|nr:hypothetical protein B0H63DRAFT_523323 [Podospora didyma]
MATTSSGSGSPTPSASTVDGDVIPTPASENLEAEALKRLLEETKAASAKKAEKTLRTRKVITAKIDQLFEQNENQAEKSLDNNIIKNTGEDNIIVDDEFVGLVENGRKCVADQLKSLEAMVHAEETSSMVDYVPGTDKGKQKEVLGGDKGKQQAMPDKTLANLANLKAEITKTLTDNNRALINSVKNITRKRNIDDTTADTETDKVLGALREMAPEPLPKKARDDNANKGVSWLVATTPPAATTRSKPRSIRDFLKSATHANEAKKLTGKETTLDKAKAYVPSVGKPMYQTSSGASHRVNHDSSEQAENPKEPTISEPQNPKNSTMSEVDVLVYEINRNQPKGSPLLPPPNPVASPPLPGFTDFRRQQFEEQQKMYQLRKIREDREAEMKLQQDENGLRERSHPNWKYTWSRSSTWAEIFLVRRVPPSRPQSGYLHPNNYELTKLYDMNSRGGGNGTSRPNMIPSAGASFNYTRFDTMPPSAASNHGATRPQHIIKPYTAAGHHAAGNHAANPQSMIKPPTGTANQPAMKPIGTLPPQAAQAAQAAHVPQPRVAVAAGGPSKPVPDTSAEKDNGTISGDDDYKWAGFLSYLITPSSRLGLPCFASPSTSTQGGNTYT